MGIKHKHFLGDYFARNNEINVQSKKVELINIIDTVGSNVSIFHWEILPSRTLYLVIMMTFFML